MQVQESNYIWPPRPKHAIPFEDARVLYNDLSWIAQLKYNDSRCLIKYLEDGTIELWNRHAEKFRSYNPPDWLILQLQEVATKLDLQGHCLLDGGLLDQKHRAIKDTIVLWDVLVRNGEHLLDTTYLERYDQIFPRDRMECQWDQESYAWFYKQFPIGEKLTDNVFVARNLVSDLDWGMAWEMVEQMNEPFDAEGIGPLLEGLVFKDPNGRLEMGWSEKNNESWQARSRVSTGRHEF